MLPQDLHDYDDVAENYDLYLDAMYSSEDNHAGFQEFYLDFAREYGKDGCVLWVKRSIFVNPSFLLTDRGYHLHLLSELQF